jgi:hypothetical protein
MREFTQYLQRWKDVIFSSQYEVTHNSEENYGKKEYAFDIIQSEGKQQIVPINEDHRNSISGTVRVKAASEYQIHPIRQRAKKLLEILDFEVEPLRDEELSLTSPVTNTSLRYVRFSAYRNWETTTRGKPRKEPGSYQVTSCILIADHQQNDDFLYSNYRLYPKSVEVKRENDGFPPMSNAYVRKLLKLVDSFIPRQEPQPAKPQQPIPVRRAPG